MVKRHLLVTNDFPPKVGGIQSYLWELWSRLDPDSFAVLTASSHPGAADYDAEQAQHGIRIERVSGHTLYLPTVGALRRVRAMVRDLDASIVVLDPAVPLGMLGPRLGIPFAVVLHGAEVTVPARVPVSRRALAHVLGRASLAISAGGYPAAEAAGVAGSRMPPVVEIPPGVDCGRFAPLDEASRRAARHRLGLPPDGLLVASVSRLVPRKGMDVLVEAVRRLRPSFPDLTLAIAGGGRQEGELAAQARRSGAVVELLGRIGEEDKALLLGASDVFVMACRTRWLGLEQEGFGIVFMEAAACGIPQVAGTSGGAAEAVDDGETGVVVRHPDDPGAVAEALRRLLVDPELRRRMGAAARRRAVASFDYARLAPRLADALSEHGA
ncbi:MAG: glycosyltransferase family 4 protein [Acidimicrobiales bacterium]